MYQLCLSSNSLLKLHASRTMLPVILLLTFAVSCFVLFFVAGKKRREGKVSASQTKNEKEDNLLMKVTSESKGNVVQFTISLNQEEANKRLKNGTLFKPSPPREKDIDEIAGFYCQAENSPNQVFTVCFCDGYTNIDQWVDGDIALLKGKEKLYHIKIQRPNSAHVSNDGIVVCADRVNSDLTNGEFMLFDPYGKILFQHKVKANIGETAISADSTLAVFDTYGSDNEDSSQVFLIDVPQNRSIRQFERNFDMSSASFDLVTERIRFSNHKGYTYETDYFGSQTNLGEYEKQVWELGSIYEKIHLFEKIPIKERNENQTYVPLLEAAIVDPVIISSNYQGIVFRKLGEYYESQNDIPATIGYFEKALAVDPKIGVRRKLDKYIKAINKTH